ncbi:MAG: hypothetical protein HZA51_04945 [Planctomycetes bacterium]|nr:hypothetical protein [Planctomycetota bacterium]
MVAPNKPEPGVSRLIKPDDMYWEEVERARQLPISEKVFAGIDLFELACEFTLSGIRAENPDAGEDQILDLLRQRLALARRLEGGE